VKKVKCNSKKLAQNQTRITDSPSEIWLEGYFREMDKVKEKKLITAYLTSAKSKNEESARGVAKNRA
jgi:hypothetical protein